MYVMDYLRDHHVTFEPLLHCPASSATRLAGNLHIPGRAVAKAVLVRAGEALVLAVLPATSRIDLERLGAALLVAPEHMRLATEEEIFQTFPDCEPGRIPPFGRFYGLTTAVDEALAEAGSIVVGANTRHEDMRMLYSDYAALEQPLRISFGQPARPAAVARTLRPRHRRAS